MDALRSAWSIVLLPLLMGVCFADDGSDAPVVYSLEIDGQTVTLSPDQPLKLQGDFSNPTVTLRVAKTRTLQAAGIAFDFPAYFTYEADTSDPDVQTWTAEGNDVTVMLFNFTETVDPRVLAQSTAEALESQQLNIEPVKLKLGDADRNGVKATMALGGQSLIQHVLALPPTPKGSRLFVVQEVRSEGESEAAELGATLKLVSSSLKVNP